MGRELEWKSLSIRHVGSTGVLSSTDPPPMILGDIRVRPEYYFPAHAAGDCHGVSLCRSLSLAPWDFHILRVPICSCGQTHAPRETGITHETANGSMLWTPVKMHYYLPR